MGDTFPGLSGPENLYPWNSGGILFFNEREDQEHFIQFGFMVLLVVLPSYFQALL